MSNEEAKAAMKQQARLAQAAADLLDIAVADSPTDEHPEISVALAMAHVFVAASGNGMMKDLNDAGSAGGMLMKAMATQIALAAGVDRQAALMMLMHSAQTCPIEIIPYDESGRVQKP